MLLLIFGFGLFVFGYCLASALAPAADRRDRLIAAFPLGAGFHSLIVFCLSSSFGTPLQPSLLWRSLGVCILSSLAGSALRTRRRRPSGREHPPGAPRMPLTALAGFELALLAGIAALSAATAVLVPVSYWDSYSEYLPRAKEMFLTHAVSADASPSPVDILRALPPGHCILVASGYCIAGFIAHPWARLLTPLYACLLLALLYRIGRRHLSLSPETALGGLLLCISLPIFYEVAIIPAGTIPFCFCSTASLYFFLERGAPRKSGMIQMSGVFLGLAYWISYTGTVLLACFFTLTLLLAAATAFGKKALPPRLQLKPREIVSLFLPAVLLAAPHMIKNYAALGNPVYPAMYRIFGGAWITDWAVAHLIPRVVPAHSFFFRPRWELFHEGFFIQLLFLFSLFSRPWHKDGKALFLVLFCALYWLFYLNFLTWPRGSGISTKLLLPALIPMCLFAGERLNLLLLRKLPLLQGAAILALVPLWTIVIWRDDMLSWGIEIPARPHPRDVIHLAWALSADFDKPLLWIGAAIGLVSARIAGRALGRLSAALLLLALACRPLCECANQLSIHLQEHSRSPSYSFWNAAFLPSYFPEAAWLDANLPPDAVIGSLDNRIYLYPRRVFPLDSPPVWPIYRGADIERCVAILRRNGITHLCLSDYTTKPHPLYGMSPVFNNLGDPRYLPMLYHGPSRMAPGEEFRVYGVGGQKDG